MRPNGTLTMCGQDADRTLGNPIAIYKTKKPRPPITVSPVCPLSSSPLLPRRVQLSNPPPFRPGRRETPVRTRRRPFPTLSRPSRTIPTTSTGTAPRKPRPTAPQTSTPTTAKTDSSRSRGTEPRSFPPLTTTEQDAFPKLKTATPRIIRMMAGSTSRSSTPRAL